MKWLIAQSTTFDNISGVKVREFTDRGVSGARGSRPALDNLPVRAVYRELVSGPKSLIYKENAGKSPKTRLHARPASATRPLLEVLAGVFPRFENREIRGVLIRASVRQSVSRTPG